MSAQRSVALASLLHRLPNATLLRGNLNVAISGVVADSRNVMPGSLFVALRGEHVDGHDFVPQAIERGATAVLVERDLGSEVQSQATVVRVEQTRRALSAIAAAFYGDPSHDLAVIGVTGTNGKTTTTRMLAAIAQGAGVPCAVIGTIGAEFGGQEWRLAQTTPLPEELHALLARLRDAGARAVAMEVSSHALALDRVTDVRFACGVLTNVTRDHLDFHGSIESYAAAKRRLFEASAAAVLNVDDAHGARWAAELHGRKPLLTYATRGSADIVARDIALRPDGSRFIVDDTAFELALPGRFNVENALAATGAARTLGIEDTASARALRGVTRVAGRMERIGEGDVHVFVDYAHTPDALEQSLRAVRELARANVAVVFGCGGDRDRGKRPEMGAIAGKLADRVYVTNDNPRTEDPEAIACEIVAGIGTKHVVELDRRKAIERAVREASAGDVVLIAGKGHETYQIIGDRRLPFDDAAVAREALGQRP